MNEEDKGALCQCKEASKAFHCTLTEQKMLTHSRFHTFMHTWHGVLNLCISCQPSETNDKPECNYFLSVWKVSYKGLIITYTFL